MATKKKIKLNATDRMQFLEWQRDILELDNQIRGLLENKAAINQKGLEKIGQLAKAYKVDPKKQLFDIKTLEFRDK